MKQVVTSTQTNNATIAWELKKDYGEGSLLSVKNEAPPRPKKFTSLAHGEEKKQPTANIGDETSTTSRPTKKFKIKPFSSTNYLSDANVVGC